MKKLLKWVDENLEEEILLALLGVISCVMMIQVIMRFVFKSSLAWPEELTRYCFVYSGFIAAGYCIKKGFGYRIDVIVQYFPKVIQNVMDFLNKIILLVFYGYLFLKSFDLMKVTISSGALSTAMQLPMQYVYFAVPLGFGIAAVRALQDILVSIKTKQLKNKKKEGELN